MKRITHIGEAFRFIRLSKGLEQKHVATASGLSEGYISQLECGHRDPNWTTITKVCAALEVPITYVIVLLEGTNSGVKQFVPAVTQELWNMARGAA